MQLLEEIGNFSTSSVNDTTGYDFVKVGSSDFEDMRLALEKDFGLHLDKKRKQLSFLVIE